MSWQKFHTLKTSGVQTFGSFGSFCWMILIRKFDESSPPPLCTSKESAWLLRKASYTQPAFNASGICASDKII